MNLALLEPELSKEDAYGLLLHVAKNKQRVFDYFLVFHECFEDLL
jgi:hypothetical protein